MTSTPIKQPQPSASNVAQPGPQEDLFERFQMEDGQHLKAAIALQATDEWEEGEWVEDRRRLRASLDAVEMELQQETEAAAAALEQITAELTRLGLMQRPDLKQGVDALSTLVQGVHQGLGGCLSDSLKEHFEEIRQYIERVSQQIRQVQDSDHLMRVAVRAVRQFLGVERSLIYRFEGGDRGLVVLESLEPGWTPMQSELLPTLCFGMNQVRDYQRQQVILQTDTLQTATAPYQKQLIERFQMRASLAVPLFVNDRIWGLLVAQQCHGPRPWYEATDINFMVQLSHQVGLALQQILTFQQQQEWLQQAKLVSKIGERILQLRNIQDLFNVTVGEVRRFMKADRVGVFQFYPNSGFDDGEFVAEDVDPDYPSALAAKIHDHCFGNQYADQYRYGRVQAVADIYSGELSPCHISVLSDFAIRANLIVPLIKGGELWGLLCVHQCRGPRLWKETEIELLRQIASQFAIAFQQVEASQKLAEQVAREQALNRVISRIRQTTDLDTIFTVTTQEVRRLLNVERVTIYKFRDNFFGDFVSESNTGGFPKLVGSGWEDPYLNEHQGGRFRDNLPLVVDDIHAGETLWENGHLHVQVPRKPMTDCHIEALEYYQAQACLVVSIFKGDQLWGLLSAFQNTQPRSWSETEVQLLMQVATQIGVAIQQAEYINQIQNQSTLLSAQAERVTNYARIIGQISQRSIDRINRQDHNLEPFLASITQDVRQVLQADRVAIYRFAPDWSGEFIVEDHTAGWVKLVGSDMAWVRDSYLQETQGGRYRQNQSLRVDNVYAAGHSPCHLELLVHLQAKAYMIAPIFKGDTLWGLLGAYQNSDFRHWEDTEMNLLSQAGAQLGSALLQAEYIRLMEQQSAQLQEAAEREKAAKTHLQQQIVQMLTAVRPALQGDLTVRAPVTEDAVGTVADAYNNTIQSLRKLVMQVKGATERVRETSEMNGGAIALLSQQTQEELAQVTGALEQLEEMVQATESVTENAQRMELAVQRANETVQTGDNAMNLTVEGILTIRETVSETTRKIKRLSESSQKISKVVSLISNFTTQTQLLALNAAIEATRAGEYGRGFAVVADEVRSLAQQSAEATGEIESLVQEIQAETNGVSAAMDLGIQQVVEGTNLVNQTRQSLNDIVTATAQIRDLIQGITASTQAQMHQSNAVTQAMEDVAAIARKTSTDSTEIAHSFQSLLQTAEVLQQSVDQFKVN